MSESEKKVQELEYQNILLKAEISSFNKVQEERDSLQRIYRMHQLRFQTIFEESSLGNQIMNNNLVIIKVNKNLIRILGYTEEELVGKKIIEFTHPDFVKEWKKLRRRLWLAKKTLTSFSIDICLIRKDKSMIWCHATSILFDDHGDRLGYTIIEDITEKKEKELIRKKLAERESLLKFRTEQQKRQKELFETIVRAQEEERERIAEQLHNSLGQMLYAVKLRLSLINPNCKQPEKNNLVLAETHKLLAESITECRNTAHHLLPRVLNDFGLREAIEDLGQHFHPTINFKLKYENISPIKEKYGEILIFRTVQELLLNIQKHAEASQAACKIQIYKKTIRITVEDNGKGFDPNTLKKNGLGLSALKSRIEQVEGTFYISSKLHKGTIVSITLPRRMF